MFSRTSPLVLILSFGGKDGLLFNPVPVSVYTDNASGGGVPVGTIIAWPVTKNPNDWDKWLECNGQSISSTVYPELYAVVGSKVPDYRGLFLRGYGSQTSSHYGSVTHSSETLNTIQGDAIREIWGESRTTVMTQGALYTGALDEMYGDSLGMRTMSSPGWLRNRWNFKASRVVPVATENRPVNKAVRYLIRAKS